MSANRQRLVTAIRRIAKTDPEISSALAGVGVRGDQPTVSGIGVSSGADSRQCCDGSEASGGGEGNANPGTEQTEGGGNPQAGGLDSDDPARLESNEGEPAETLKDVTDCATGQPVSVQLASGDWSPPEGWSTPTTPPPDPTYVPDMFWVMANDIYGVGFICSTASATKGAAISKTDSTIFKYPVQKECSSGLCSGAGCSPEPSDIYPSVWPDSDGSVQLAVKGGAIVGSKYDPANDGSYNLPRNGIELCDAHGNSILLEATESGGWRSIKSLGGEPDPDTVGYEYNGRGEIVRVMSTGEWQATGRDPRNF